MVNGIFYNELKSKEQRAFLTAGNEDMLVNAVVSMIELKDADKIGINDFFIEYYLMTDGYCAIIPTPEDWGTDAPYIVTQVDFAGNLNPNGIGKKAICTTLNGHQKTYDNWETDEDIVIIFNNKALTPDFTVTRACNLLTELDVSIKVLAITSRASKLIYANDDEEQAKVKEALQSVYKDGSPAVVCNSGLRRQMLGMSLENSPVSLTDPQDSDRIQYLIKAYDDVLRQFYNVNGMMNNGNGKMAQQTNAEINDGADLTSINPLNKLETRNKSIEKLRKMTGVDTLEFVFSTAWKREEAKKEILDAPIEGGMDNDNTAGIAETRIDGTGDQIDDISGTDMQDSGVLDGDGGGDSNTPDSDFSDGGDSKLSVDVDVNINTDPEPEDVINKMKGDKDDDDDDRTDDE